MALLWISIMLSKYFRMDTGLPWYDGMIKNPDYYKRAKQVKFKIVQMSPRKYMEEVAKQQHTSVGRQYEMVSPDYVERYKQRALAGEKMPLLSLESTSYADTQEGRHRAVVAEELGVKKIPVIVVKDLTVDEWQLYMKKNHPEEWKYMR